MPSTCCDYCQQPGTLAAGRPDRLLVARVVDMMPPTYIVRQRADVDLNEPIYPGKIFMIDDVAEATLTGYLRGTLTVHLRCIPSWLDEHPELAITSSKPSDI